MKTKGNNGRSRKLLIGYGVICAFLSILGMINYVSLNGDMLGVYFLGSFLSIMLVTFYLIKRGYYVLGKFILIITPPYFFLIMSVFLKVHGIMDTKLIYLLPRLFVLLLAMGPIMFFGMKHTKQMIIALVLLAPPVFLFDLIHNYFGIYLENLAYDHSFYSLFRGAFFIVYCIPLASILLAQKTNILFKKELLKVNKTIKNQQATLSATHKELTDSVSYAKLLQESLLPNKETLDHCFTDAAVLFVPKDEISGDFYFAYEFDEYTYFGIGDCTGHGIPGAFLAAMSIEAMKTVIHEEVGIMPNHVLDKLREIAKSRFSLNVSQSRSDSMDGGVCLYNKKDGKFYYSGGFINLLIIRAGEIIEITSDKCPIGAYPVENPFTLNEIGLEDGDVICLCSDGYVDQFGFDENSTKKKPAKFKRKRLYALLREINALSCDEQVKKLEQNLDNWSGNLDQIDDVTIFLARHSTN